MKKFISLILALAMLACMSVTAFAAGHSAGTTIVNLEVPDNTPSYIFHCPASVSITYGVAGYQDIGEISVTDVKNIVADAVIDVELHYTDLINTENDSDSITMSLGYKKYDHSDDYSNCPDGFLGPSFCVDPEVEDTHTAKIAVKVGASEWEKATPRAKYQATITYVVDIHYHDS